MRDMRLSSGEVRPAAIIRSRGHVRLTRADALMLLTMLIWGANIVSVKVAVRVILPLGFGFLRYLLAGVILLVLLRAQEGSIGLRRADAPALALAAVVGIGLNQVGFLLGIRLISASLAAIILATTPLLTAGMAALWAHEPLRWRTLLALTISLAGVIVAIATGSTRLDASWLGGALIGGAALMLGLGAILAKRPLRAATSLRVTTWMVLCGGLALLPVGLPALLATPRAAVTPTIVAATAFTVLGSTVLGQLAWNYAIKHLGATRTATYTYLQPLVGLGVAGVVLGERLHALQVLGGAVVVVGLVLYARGTQMAGRHQEGTALTGERTATGAAACGDGAHPPPA